MHLAGTGRPGGIAIVPRGWDGRWDIEEGGALSYVLLDDTCLQSASRLLARGRRLELLPRLAEPDPVGSRILRMLSHEAAHPMQGSGLFVEQALDLLCTHLVRAHSSMDTLPPPAPSHGLPQRQVRRVIAYLSERLDQDVGLKALADLTSLSRSHFCTAFRIATGSTPYQQLTRLRVERARLLLGDPRASITDVALAVGYQTPSAFTAAFRRHTGVTPSSFRRSL